ncbi:MAG: hypothetical protein IPL52_11555 [Flavobacteriales bacterium]|nr:hypothetical protein [Flavobacteriales bacterium]
MPRGEKATFRIAFSTHWSMNVARRMKLFSAWGAKHYDGVHWYPRIAVYDRKFGWDTQQHLGSEFYGDFGTYDVDLDFPHQYVLDATGVLQNPAEAMPADLRARLDIANFGGQAFGTRHLPWWSNPTLPSARFGSSIARTRTTSPSPPTPLIGSAKRNGTAWNASPSHKNPTPASGRTLRPIAPKVIEAHSTSWGMYAYPKMMRGRCTRRHGIPHAHPRQRKRPQLPWPLRA